MNDILIFKSKQITKDKAIRDLICKKACINEMKLYAIVFPHNARC